MLASSEVRSTLDSETADPFEVQAKVVQETNSMVEEFAGGEHLRRGTHTRLPGLRDAAASPGPASE